MQDYFQYGCDNMTALEVNYRTHYCNRAPMAASAIEYVDPHDFEVALVNAVEHIGYRTKLRGTGPVRDPTTPTGWKL